jgi:hypothetical protein
MKAEQHSYKKLHRNLLSAAQSGVTKIALKGTPFRKLPRKHGASARPMNSLATRSAFLFQGVEILKRDSSTMGIALARKNKKSTGELPHQ